MQANPKLYKSKEIYIGSFFKRTWQKKNFVILNNKTIIQIMNKLKAKEISSLKMKR
jgi:hypothetical protein